MRFTLVDVLLNRLTLPCTNGIESTISRKQLDYTPRRIGEITVFLSLFSTEPSEANSIFNTTWALYFNTLVNYAFEYNVKV